MRINDLVGMCINNLLRHSSRTVLTILGVIVGCCSVVLMMSFSIGIKIEQESMIESYGDLQMITVYSSSDKNKINDTAIKSIQGIENVLAVNAKLNLLNLSSVSIISHNDQRFEAQYPYLVGVNSADMDLIGYELKEGKSINSKSVDVIEALAGEYFAYELMDLQRPEGYNKIDYWEYMYNDNGDDTEMPDPYIDPIGKEFDIIIGDDGSGKTLKYKIKITGIMKEDNGKGYETMAGVIIDKEAAKKIIREYNQLNGIYSQPTYDEVTVKANNIQNVSDIQKQIDELGYSTYSLESMREAQQKEIQHVQFMFLGLGSVSLFVAALGIMNTMIMAISERKREIGVMKAIGCIVGDIRKMFLMEAGFIGLVGGILGIIVSYAISAAINLISHREELENFETVIDMLFNSTSRISVITPNLAIGAVLFSIFVGVAAGFYPANSAVKVTALEAIKSD